MSICKGSDIEIVVLPDVKILSSVTLYPKDEAIQRVLEIDPSREKFGEDEWLDYIYPDMFGKTYHRVYVLKDNSVMIVDKNGRTWVVEAVYIESFEI